MKKKIIAIAAVVAVVAIIGVAMCLKSGASRFASAQALDLEAITKTCITEPGGSSKITTQYVGKEVEVNGEFKNLKIVSPIEAKFLGIEGKNLWRVNLIHKTKVQHKKPFDYDNKTEDTSVIITCFVAEEEGKKLQEKKNIGDNVELCGIFVEATRESMYGSHVTLVLKDGVAR